MVLKIVILVNVDRWQQRNKTNEKDSNVKETQYEMKQKQMYIIYLPIYDMVNSSKSRGDGAIKGIGCAAVGTMFDDDLRNQRPLSWMCRIGFAISQIQKKAEALPRVSHY